MGGQLKWALCLSGNPPLCFVAVIVQCYIFVVWWRINLLSLSLLSSQRSSKTVQRDGNGRVFIEIRCVEFKWSKLRMQWKIARMGEKHARYRWIMNVYSRTVVRRSWTNYTYIEQRWQHCVPASGEQLKGCSVTAGLSYTGYAWTSTTD